MLSTRNHCCGINLLYIKILRVENMDCNLDFRRVSTTTTNLVEVAEMVETQKLLSISFAVCIILLILRR